MDTVKGKFPTKRTLGKSLYEKINQITRKSVQFSGKSREKWYLIGFQILHVGRTGSIEKTVQTEKTEPHNVPKGLVQFKNNLIAKFTILFPFHSFNFRKSYWNVKLHNIFIINRHFPF